MLKYYSAQWLDANASSFAPNLLNDTHCGQTLRICYLTGFGEISSAVIDAVTVYDGSISVSYFSALSGYGHRKYTLPDGLLDTQ